MFTCGENSLQYHFYDTKSNATGIHKVPQQIGGGVGTAINLVWVRSCPLEKRPP